LRRRDDAVRLGLPGRPHPDGEDQRPGDGEREQEEREAQQRRSRPAGGRPAVLGVAQRAAAREDGRDHRCCRGGAEQDEHREDGDARGGTVGVRVGVQRGARPGGNDREQRHDRPGGSAHGPAGCAVERT
jgi:hypothetical protein